MLKINLLGIPSHTPRQQLDEKILSIAKMNVFSQAKTVTLSYLGGITNYGLQDRERNLFIRIPGNHSDLLVDRIAELDTLQKLASHNLYPPLVEAYSEGELAGYKIEHFIEGETLQFDSFYLHQKLVLPSLKNLHDSNLKFLNEFNIFARLYYMLEILKTHEIHTIPYFDSGQLSELRLEKIRSYVDELQNKMASLFPYVIQLSPCHNDITPINIIKLNNPTYNRFYQIIDWEYAGMNDEMYDLAMLAAMLGLSPAQQIEFVLNYFDSSDKEQYVEEIKRVRFYTPLVKLYYGIWAALQIALGNESSSTEELKSGWGPLSITVFLEQYQANDYQDLLHSSR